MLHVQAIHTYYGESYVLQGVTLDVQAGEVVALLGRNGVGKTTTLRSIIGLTPPRAGRVVFEGQDITGWSPFRIAALGVVYVPENGGIFQSLTVWENLLAVPQSDLPANRWDLDRVTGLFPLLKERRNKKGGTLSGGERQMLALARALLQRPRLLMLDEPAEGLAPMVVERLAEVIESLSQEGTTMLIVEQRLRLLARVVQRCYIMSRGRVVHEARPKELLADVDLQRQYLGVRG